MDNRKTAFIVMLTAVVSMGIGAGGVYLKYKDSIEYGEKYPVVIESYNFMKDAETPMPENVSDEAQVNSYLKLYDDEYTFYSANNSGDKDAILEQVNNSPTACGCGFAIDFDKENQPYFSSVEENKPAYEQGFRTGDTILSIANNTIENMEDVKKIKGKQGTIIDIVIKRDEEQKTIQLERFSDNLVSEGVEYEKYGETLYIKYPQVQGETVSSFLNVLEENEFDSIVIDIRNNGGGEVSLATSSTSPFIGHSVVSMHGYDGNESEFTSDEEIKYDVPIILLVNENTASSAEIITALLKQYANTMIVGTTTFGKGIYQGFGTFKGGMVRYTQGTFTVGDWECWQGVGIEPDIEIEMDSSLIGTDEDIQLQKAIELLS